MDGSMLFEGPAATEELAAAERADLETLADAAVASCLRKDIPALHVWLLKAQPGSVAVYHVGELSRDAQHCPEAHQARCLVDWAYQMGLVAPVQRRIGPKCFSYEAQRTSEVWALPAPMFDSRGRMRAGQYEVMGYDSKEVE